MWKEDLLLCAFVCAVCVLSLPFYLDGRSVRRRCRVSLEHRAKAISSLAERLLGLVAGRQGKLRATRHIPQTVGGLAQCAGGLLRSLVSAPVDSSSHHTSGSSPRPFAGSFATRASHLPRFSHST